MYIHLLAYENGTDRVFRNVGIWNSDAGELPRRNIQHRVHGESLKSRKPIFITDLNSGQQFGPVLKEVNTIHTLAHSVLVTNKKIIPTVYILVLKVFSCLYLFQLKISCLFQKSRTYRLIIYVQNFTVLWDNIKSTFVILTTTTLQLPLKCRYNLPH
jgi:hypothetical protein